MIRYIKAKLLYDYIIASQIKVYLVFYGVDEYIKHIQRDQIKQNGSQNHLIHFVDSDLESSSHNFTRLFSA